MEPLIRFEKITKKFGGTTALNGVSFEIQEGEIHCLCGENGAGKSTLINLCAGVCSPTSGKIYINGTQEHIDSIKKSKSLGFSIIHQEVPLCPNMSIADNIFLSSNENRKGVFVNRKYMLEKTQELLEMFKLKLRPEQLVETLSIAEQSIIQIVKAVYSKPRILIMDEPTAAMTNDQRDVMFQIIKKLRDEYKTTILYVSHRLEEILEIGDTVSVLRDGYFIGSHRVKDITIDDLITMMVGRQIDRTTACESCATAETLLKVCNITRRGEFENVSFELKAGEILGFGGFVGAGRTEIMNALFGVTHLNAGEIYLYGEKAIIRSPRDAIRKGISLIPENRRDDALVAEMSIKDNAVLILVDQLSTWGLISEKRKSDIMREMAEKYNIRTSNTAASVMTLSGGNQQKVVIARWISNSPKILICDEPTRGVDVGAKAEVYEILRGIAKKGVGIILVSSELPELLALSDRIIIMHEGRITGELSKDEATEEQVMRFAAAVG